MTHPNEPWCVLVDRGPGVEPVVYGPMDADVAQKFARFMTANVDPATVRRLHSPDREMLNWFEAEIARNNAGAQ